MGAQLDQILGYLDRPNVSEVLLGVGRPITLRRGGDLVPLTAQQLTRNQLLSLVQGTPLARLMPEHEGTGDPTDVEVGARRIRVQAGRRGDDVLLRIEKAPPPVNRQPISAPADLDLEVEPDGPPLELEAPTPPPRTPVHAAPPSRTPVRVAFNTAPAPAPAPAPTLDLELEAPTPPRRTAAPALPPETAPPQTRHQTGAGRASRSTQNPPLASSASPVGFVELVRAAQDLGASDLHIATGRTVAIRVLGELVPIDSSPALSALEVDALLMPLLSAELQARLAEVGYVDLAVQTPEGGRLRTNISRHQGGLKGTFRIARSQPATLEELGLPRELAKVVSHHQGLVIVAGPSGHGKTTTLAALADIINSSKPHHIITVEDPVEIVYPRKAAVVSQREVGPHTKSFAAALKGSLREDPDVIVIGELRDRETVEIALTAAETGHLVLATMSTPNAAKTIDRLVDMFPPADQSQVRASIAGALRAVVSQRLLPAANGTGVVAAVELLTGVLPLAAMIRDDKLYQLPNLMQRGRAFGMVRMDDSLIELVRTGRITAETAIAASDNKREIASTLRPGAPQPGMQPRPGAEPAAPAPPPKGGRLANLFGGKKDRE